MKPGQIGYGLPPHSDSLVDLAREIGDLRREVGELRGALSGSLAYQSFSADATGLSFPSGAGFNYYAVTSAITPPAWAGAYLIFASASAGVTFSGAGGAISVGIGTGGSPTGPFSTVNAIGNGTSGANSCSVNSTYSLDSSTAPATSYLCAMVAVNGTTGSSGNAHINGIIVWMRS